jgi:2-hydroxymuconate-semialdehyde hydrolase
MRIPWPVPLLLVAGCSASLDPSRRLTSFREELYQEGALRDLYVDGRRYCVVEMGQGSPLVLVHGLGGSLYDWRHLLRPLAEEHRVIAMDLLGAGESDIPEGADYSVSAQARRLKRVLDRLEVGRATFIGSSYGGGISLQVAQDWPERVDRLVLLNSICYAENIPAYVPLAKIPLAGCIAEAIPLSKASLKFLGDPNRVIGIMSETELDDYIRELERPGRRSAMIDVLRALVPPDTSEFEARLKSITSPALLLWGVADTTVPIELGRRLVRDLGDARLFELDAGHVPNQECPDKVLRLIREFVGPPPGPSSPDSPSSGPSSGVEQSPSVPAESPQDGRSDR